MICTRYLAKIPIAKFQNCLKFQITYNNFEISLVVFMPNITTNHAITNTNKARSTIRHTFTKEKNSRTKSGAGAPWAHP